MASTSEWFRSAEMEYISIVMQEHVCHRVLSRVGRLGAVQFTDLSPQLTASQRRYINEVQRCDEVERKLVFFDSLLKKYQIQNSFHYDAKTFLDKVEQRDKEISQTSILEELEGLIEEKALELNELNSFRTGLKGDYNYQVELRHVLEKGRVFLASGELGASSAQSAAIADGLEQGASKAEGLSFRFLTGTVLQEDRMRFERMVFRATRGNCLMRFTEIEECLENAETGDTSVKKFVFIIFYQAQNVENKIKRICDAFNAVLYLIPDLADSGKFEAELKKVNDEIKDRDHVLQRNNTDIVNILTDLCKWIEVWKWTIAREKSIYHTMNLFSADIKGVLRAEGWVIASAKTEVQQVVYDVHEINVHSSEHLPSSVTVLPPSQQPRMPPTYFKTNRFTKVFQGIVNTYGVPRYREANPALFTVITFPFLFGVMFGDLGHGFLLFFASCFVVYKEKDLAKLKLDEFSNVIFSGRYFLLLMGFFSFYAGLLYNDFFAMGLHWFSITYEIANTEYNASEKVSFKPTGEVYPLGIDPTWHHADNGLLFFNSVKMKMSVIFGVTQMTFGLFLKLANAIHFRSNLDIFFEAIPQIIFMSSLFGYMCFLIVYKWCLDWGSDCSRENSGTGNCNPPSLITTLINIALKIGDVPKEELLYESQPTVQTVLLVLALLMVPLMLIPKPLILSRRLKAHQNTNGSHSSATKHDRENGAHEPMLSNQEIDGQKSGPIVQGHGTVGDIEGFAANDPGATVASDEEHSSGDLWIHQAIETIEFVLAGISNTASYLRLWALSLAHSQLGTVFLEKALLDYMTTDGAAGILITFLGYGAFAAVTFAVLMVMDNLECFLHALRLHWVEFQSKFFKADGVLFTPLHFEKIIKHLEKKQD